MQTGEAAEGSGIPNVQRTVNGLGQERDTANCGEITVGGETGWTVIVDESMSDSVSEADRNARGGSPFRLRGSREGDTKSAQ